MARSLRSAIEEHSPLIVPSIYDGISALLVKEIGFAAAYVGSYATGATKYGVPDLGYIGLEDMADQTRRLSAIVDVPLIVDGEGGWGNPLHVARSVRVLERAGASATHLEDHEFGKHLTMRSRIAPVGVAVDKIKAALDARDSEDFLIIARTDSPGSEGPAAAVDRLLAYQEAGADGLFLGGFLDEAAHARLRAEAHVPIFQPDFPGHTAAVHAEQSADVVIYYGLTHIAASAGMRSALEVLKRDESTISLEGELSTQGFDEFLGVAEARDKARQYGLIEG